MDICDSRVTFATENVMCITNSAFIVIDSKFIWFFVYVYQIFDCNFICETEKQFSNSRFLIGQSNHIYERLHFTIIKWSTKIATKSYFMTLFNEEYVEFKIYLAQNILRVRIKVMNKVADKIH